jgi:hypothetical protein
MRSSSNLDCQFNNIMGFLLFFCVLPTGFFLLQATHVLQ